jgi:hypothetical protein
LGKRESKFCTGLGRYGGDSGDLGQVPSGHEAYLHAGEVSGDSLPHVPELQAKVVEDGMSAFSHNSPAAERFAMRAHQVWAFASLGQAIFALAAAWILYPIAMSSLGFFGHYVFGLLLLLYAQIILGVGGMIFHIAGARDHRNNLGE